MFDFDPDFNFNFKNFDIRKQFLNTIKSKSFKRLITVLIFLSIYIAILYTSFLVLNISFETKSSGFIEGVEQFQLQPVSPYLNNQLTNLVVMILPLGIVFIIIFFIFRYKKIDDEYFRANKQTYKAKVIIVPNKRKFAKQKNNFVCVEVLINENDKENPTALLELPYILEDENTEITIEYLAENNEARLSATT